VSDVASDVTSLRIGTRGSALALWQARAVETSLRARHPGIRTTLEIIRPEGDVDKHSSLTAIGGRGVFTSALQYQLLAATIDMAVHSTKDLPSLAPDGIGIAAFPQREDARDALVSRHDVGLRELPPNPVIGTSSRRRAAQIQAIRPDAVIRDLRGNIDTRLAKGTSDAYDAVILAAAGLRRLGWEDKITTLLSVERFVPAPGQGALAIEARTAPDPAWKVVAGLDDADVRLAVATERAFLRGVGGGCTTPIGAHAVIERMHGIATVRFWGMLASDDGARLERVYEEYPLDGAEERAFAAAGRLIRSVAPKWTGIGDANPLAGLRVLITGSDAQATPLAKELAGHGAESIRMPTIRITAVEDSPPIQQAVDRAVDGAFDWLVLTSANAVPALASHLRGRSAQAKVAVVGARTGEALAAAGIGVDLVSPGYGADALVDELAAAGVAGSRVLCLLSDRARPVLVDGLLTLGAQVQSVTAYRNEAVQTVDDNIRQRIRRGHIDAITFASPSAAQSFKRLAGPDLPALSGAGFFAIGPTTADALREQGLPVHAVAREQDAEGFIEALRGYFGHNAADRAGEPA
jgi:hydroxymethylbilane synthase